MSVTQSDVADTRSAWELPELLGVAADIDRLREELTSWVEDCDPEVAPMVRRQLSGRAKYFRPVTVFACFHAMTSRPLPNRVLRAAAAVELAHNVSLVTDDILDRSRYRRGELSLHCRYGFLPALMTAGYMGFAAPALVAEDAYSVRLLSELMQGLGAAECARIGTRDDRLRKFGRLLGMLYHGCDDVADVRGTAALGGGSEKDIIDGILTLPAAIAVRDPSTAALFRNAGRETFAQIAVLLQAALPEAECYLDRLAAETEAEAIANAQHPERLLELIQHTRMLASA
jgi:geranylgeranyl diphosphate synthase type I